MIERIKSHLQSLLNWLNMLGTVALAYALANPNAVAELIKLLPPPVQPYAPMLALGWFLFVQYAKARAIKKAAA